MKTIELRHEILNDRYTEYLYDAFDIQNREETIVKIPVDLKDLNVKPWNLGVILGSSGSGKSSILNSIGTAKEVIFSKDKPLISNFDWVEPEEAALILTSMGLSSVPTWLRPFHTLSNGEQYRAKLAYLVASAEEGETILIDEYTSVVDRDVAKAMSFALQKYIRREGKKIILASCHYDILEWLMPDWTVNPQKGGVLERGDWLRQGKPQIQLQVSRVETETWDFFKKHHYLTEELNKAFHLLLFEWNDKPVGVVVYKSQPTGAVPNGYALSRTVVIPDYQGMGIGSKISEFTASILVNEGKRVFTKTVNPALGEYREKSEMFRPTSKNKKRRGDTKTDLAAIRRLSRSSYCHEYVGPGVAGFEHLLLPIKEMREGQLEMFYNELK